MIVVYKLINKLNGKFYLGSTKNYNIRRADHIRELNENKHHCIRLQHAWNKYGKNSFKFKIVEKCNIKNLLKREQHYLDTLKPYNDKIGYNISPNACGGFRGMSRKGIKSKYPSKRALPVHQYNLDGSFVREWKSGTEILQKLGFPVYAMLNKPRSLKKELRSIKGYIWCYANKHPKIYKNYHDDVIKKPILQFSKEGNFIKEWPSISDAQKALNIKGIWNSANNYKGEKTCKGFLWKYKINNPF